MYVDVREKIEKVTKVVEEKVSTIDINLTMEEASLLKYLVGQITGHVTGPRNFTERLFYALDAAKVPDATNVKIHANGNQIHALYFDKRIS